MKYLVFAVSSLPLIGTYALLGIGITIIYQASRVINLAHGSMAMLGAYGTYQLYRWHFPIALAALGGILVGAGLGLAVERIFVRRLRGAGPTTQTVGTVAVLAFTIAAVARLWGSTPVVAPQVFPKGALHFWDTGQFVTWSNLGIFPVAMAGTAVLFALFQFTDIGLAMRGAAQNRRGASLRGVDPDVTSAFAWALGGGFAALTGILLAAATTLDPFTLSLGILPAFVAALIGGLESLPGVCVGAVIIGGIEGMVPAFSDAPLFGSVVRGGGAPQLALGLIALAVMATRGARLSTGDVRAEAM